MGASNNVKTLSTIWGKNADVIELSVLVDGQKIAVRSPVMSMKKQVNEHTVMVLEGEISETIYGDQLKYCSGDSIIQVYYGLLDKPQLLFYGLISAIEAENWNHNYEDSVKIHLEALSFTCLMDQTDHNRIFQNTKITYQDLVEKVIAGYEESAFIMCPSAAGREIKSMIMQYQETDWEFLKRMASAFHQPLVANHSLIGPKFHFGVYFDEEPYHLSEEQEQDVKIYQMRADSKLVYYCDLATKGPDKHSLEIGESVLIHGLEWYVNDVQMELKNHILKHTYRLTTKEGFTVKKSYNQAITGLSLAGMVEDVSGNQVKIAFEMEDLSGNNECWLPYSTFYSMFYCMPEKQDTVNVYFPNQKENKAIVLNSVQAPVKPMGEDEKQANFNTTELFQNNNIKVLATKAGRMVILDDESGKLSIVCSDGSYITLTEQEIQIETPAIIRIKSGESLYLEAEKSITLTAEDEISMSCQGSSILVNPDQISIEAVDIKLNEG